MPFIFFLSFSSSGVRTLGKIKCEDPEVKILDAMNNLLENENHQVRSYVNGTLYSVLSRPLLRERALQVRFTFTETLAHLYTCVDAPSVIHLRSCAFIHTPDSYSFIHLQSYTFIHTLALVHLCWCTFNHTPSFVHFYPYTFNHTPSIILMHFRCSLSLALVLCRWGWMK